MKVRLDSGKLSSDLHSIAYLQSQTTKKEKEEGGEIKVKGEEGKINKSKHALFFFNFYFFKNFLKNLKGLFPLNFLRI